MAVSYIAAAQTNRMTTVNAAINSQTFNAPSGAGSAGKLVIGTAALSGATGVISTHTLPNPAGTVSGSPPNVVLTLGAITAVNATGAGTLTAAKAEIRTSADVVIVSGLTVGTTGTDVILNSTSITNGQSVNITSAVITHAP